MEIQVGEYVRVVGGAIYKIVKEENNDEVHFEKGTIMLVGINEIKELEIIIVAHSFNLADLIEIGDYVNNGLVYSIKIHDNNVKVITYHSKTCMFGFGTLLSINSKLTNGEIKNILTREIAELYHL